VDHPEPTEQSIRLWECARRPMGLMPITPADHFFLGNNPRTQSILKGRPDVNFPVAT
jgi:hypothetical protein